MPSGTIVAVRPREHHEHHQQCVDHSPTGDGVWVQSGLQTTTSMHLPMVMRHTSSHNFRKASDQPSVELSAQAAPPPPVQYGCNSMGMDSNTTSTRLLNHIIPNHSFRNQPMFLFSMRFTASAPVSPPCPPVQIGFRSLWNSAKGPNCARLSRV